MQAMAEDRRLAIVARIKSASSDRYLEAMPKTSAGVLMFRHRGNSIELLLIHPGGPYSARKDLGAWSIPKGEIDAGEDPHAAARREFNEETSFDAVGEFIPLRQIRQKSGKTVSAWAVEGDIDPAGVRSNTFTMEWPPRSGRETEFPEVDKAGWFTVAEARSKMIEAQFALVKSLCDHLGIECS